MRSAMKDCPTCVALILALVAAVMSTPGQSGGTDQVQKWLQMGAAPEADVLAGAIGEIPPRFLSP
jgi:hypothetical protein